MTQSIYIPRGVNTEALSQSIMWDYQPQGFKVCSLFSLCETYLYQPKTFFLDACIHVPTSVIQYKMVTVFAQDLFSIFCLLQQLLHSVCCLLLLFIALPATHRFVS